MVASSHMMDLREIDRLVAEKVMGLRSTTIGLDYQLRWYHPDWPPQANTLERLPAYSADIAAAWLVVERLQGAISLIGPGAPFAHGEYARSDPGWRAEVKKPSPEWSGDVITLEAATAPLAICFAALSSVGVDRATLIGLGMEDTL